MTSEFITSYPWKNWVASITDDCQNRCPGCYRVLQDSLDNSTENLSLQKFNKILQIFKNPSLDQTVDFVGGEPLLNPYFKEMLTISLETGISPWIYTNLRSISTNPSLALFLKKLTNKFPDKLTIVGKLNVPDLNDPQQRQLQADLIGADENGVDEMWQGLNLLLQADLPQGNVGVENLLRKSNIDLAPQVYELGIKMGFFVDLELPTCPVTANRQGFQEWLEQKPTRNQVIALVKQINQINKKYNLKRFAPRPPHMTGRNSQGVGTGCISFKQGALLTEADGRLALCTSGMPLTDERGRQLNILEDPIEVILTNPAVVRRRTSTIQNNIQGDCRDCSAWNNCMAGCAALRESVLGNIFASYPLCIYSTWMDDQKLTELAFQNIKE